MEVENFFIFCLEIKKNFHFFASLKSKTATLKVEAPDFRRKNPEKKFGDYKK